MLVPQTRDNLDQGQASTTSPCILSALPLMHIGRRDCETHSMIKHRLTQSGILRFNSVIWLTSHITVLVLDA